MLEEAIFCLERIVNNNNEERQLCFFSLQGERFMKEQSGFHFLEEIKKIKSYFNFDFIALSNIQSAESNFAHKWEYVVGNRSSRYKKIVLQTGKGVAGKVFKSGRPLLVEDVETELSNLDLFDYPIVVAEGLTSFGAIPLYKNNRVKGVLLVAFRSERKVTPEMFLEFQRVVGPKFGPYYNKEMVKQ